MNEIDNVAYFRKWAADIRDSHGTSVDADKIEKAANELATAREMLARAKEIMAGLTTETDEEMLRTFEVRARFFLRPEDFIERVMAHKHMPATRLRSEP